MVTTSTGRLLETQSLFKATAVNHMSYGVSDYAKSRDFYMDLLGMTCVFDDGEQCSLAFGNPPRAFYIRKREKIPFVDHLAYSIANFDRREVETVLKRHGLDPQPDGDYVARMAAPAATVESPAPIAPRRISSRPPAR